MREHLESVAQQAPLRHVSRLVETPDAGVRATGVSGVGWQLKAHAPKCRVTGDARVVAFRTIRTLEDSR
jgi:hypothetical protein